MLAKAAAVTALAGTTLATAYFPPANNGGSMLAAAADANAGEPINVIVSGDSDAQILTSTGFLAFMESLDMSGECLGLNQPSYLSANLGDGRGSVNTTATLRYNFGNPASGTCTETMQGGNHLRYWQQTGSTANSSAWFLAVSVEQNLTLGHNIVPGAAGSNGYDLGRDWLAGNATLNSTTSAQGWTFKATSNNVTGLLAAGSSGVNHGLALDGVVTVLTVQAVTVPANATSSAGAGAPSATSASSGARRFPLSVSRQGVLPLLSVGLVALGARI